MSGALGHCVAILAGGVATRLDEITRQTPKALIEVAGEPFIAHQLRLLRAGGIARAVLCVGHLGRMIQDFVGNGSDFGVDVTYSFDGPVLLGTGGAVRNAISLLTENFFVVYGDSYLPCDYQAVMAAHRAEGKRATMTVYRNDDQFDRSNVEFLDGQILAYDKVRRTARMRHIDYGLGAFQREAFVDVPGDEPTDLADVYASLLAGGQLAAYEVHERFYEIGSREGIAQAAAYIAAHRPA